jgi:hypothetical protein
MKKIIIQSLLLNLLLLVIIALLVLNESGMQKFRYMGF